MTTRKKAQGHPGVTRVIRDDPIKFEPVKRKITARVFIWRWALARVERQWLRAHGWTETRAGWLLPTWHPRYLRSKAKNILFFSTPGPSPFWPVNRPPTALPDTQEPYDQGHAVNSQRKYTGESTVRPERFKVLGAPAYPEYLRTWAWLPAVQLSGLVCTCAVTIVGDHWTRHLFFLATVLILGLSLVLGRRARREWELDWAESQLERGRSDAVHRPN